MTRPGEEWILLSEALDLVAPTLRTGFGLFGGGDRMRILRWLADERLTARADDVVEYVVMEAPVASPQADGETSYHIALSGIPMNRKDWPLQRIERCHIHLPPEIFSRHDLQQHPVWEENELTIWMMDGTDARVIFYDIRVEKRTLLSRAGIGRMREHAGKPAASVPPSPLTDTAADLPKGKRLAVAQWDQWVAQYKRDHPTLPDVDRIIFREAKETFGHAVTQAMCREAFGGNKPGPRQR